MLNYFVYVVLLSQSNWKDFYYPLWGRTNLFGAFVWGQITEFCWRVMEKIANFGPIFTAKIRKHCGYVRIRGENKSKSTLIVR